MTASQTFCHQLWQFYGDKKIQDKYYIYLKEHCSIYNIFGVVLIWGWCSFVFSACKESRVR